MILLWFYYDYDMILLYMLIGNRICEICPVFDWFTCSHHRNLKEARPNQKIIRPVTFNHYHCVISKALIEVAWPGLNVQGEFYEGRRSGSGRLMVREGGGLFGTWEAWEKQRSNAKLLPLLLMAEILHQLIGSLSMFTPFFYRFHISQVVQDFFHQQY